MIQSGCAPHGVEVLTEKLNNPKLNALWFSSPRRSLQRLCCLLSYVSLTFFSPVANGWSAEKNPNVVIILVDDMGYGDPTCYNSKSGIPTPHIDSLARDGMRFLDAHAPGPLCHMSRYGLMTGEYPFRTDVSVWRKQPLIRPDQTTLASLMQSAGYSTAMVGKWHLGFDESGGYTRTLSGGPVDCGFDSFFGIRASTDIPPYFYIRDDRAVEPPDQEIAANRSEGWSPIQGAFWRSGGIASNVKLKDVLPRFTDEAVHVIEKHAQREVAQSLLLYLAYPAPHTPWLPSTEFKGKSQAGMYGDFAVMVDSMIGRVLAALESSGMSDDTLVIFSSDNGPVWYEEDVQRLGHDSSGGLRGMKADAWECGHRMPFIVRWPGKITPNSTSDATVCFTDLLATFSAIVGKKLPKEAGPDSFNFLPELVGTADAPARDALVMRSGNGAMTIRIGDWKLIDRLGSGGFSKPSNIKPREGEPVGQLYNLADDLSETNNLYTQHPEIVKRLSEKLANIRTSGRSRPR